MTEAQKKMDKFDATEKATSEAKSRRTVAALGQGAMIRDYSANVLGGGMTGSGLKRAREAAEAQCQPVTRVAAAEGFVPQATQMSGDVEVVHDDADMEGGGDSAGPADEFVRARSRKGSRRRDADDDDDDDDELDEQDVIFSATTGVQDTQQRVSGSRISGEAAPRLLSPNATELNAAIVGKLRDSRASQGRSKDIKSSAEAATTLFATLAKSIHEWQRGDPSMASPPRSYGGGAWAQDLEKSPSGAQSLAAADAARLKAVKDRILKEIDCTKIKAGAIMLLSQPTPQSRSSIIALVSPEMEDVNLFRASVEAMLLLNSGGMKL